MLIEIVLFKAWLATIALCGVIIFKDYLVKFYEYICIPIFKKISLSSIEIIRELISFLKYGSLKTFSYIEEKLNVFESQVLSISTTYSRINFSDVKVSTKIYTINNNIIKENDSDMVINISELPDSIQEKLYKLGKININHAEDLIKNIKRQ